MAARTKLSLRLYVAGTATNSMRAIANAKAICEAHFAAGHVLEIIDIVEQPHRGVADGIIVTPTLLKLLPLPIERVVGNLSDTSKVLLVLGCK